jgi:PKHD-type hydroxylase
VIYPFGNAPQPVNNRSLGEPFTQHMSGLSNEEIDRIRVYGDQLNTRPVTLYGGHTQVDVDARGSDFPLTDETRWLYDRMAELARQINESDYQFELAGFEENFYYLNYEGPGEHFNWHLDIGGLTPAPRKLSLVLQLSDASEYEGGEFDVLTGVGHSRAVKQKGVVTAFPAYALHRVTPVTSGHRRTLSMFTVGPNFR